MPTNQTTTGRGYPLPYPSNLLADDVVRLRDALQAIDSDITARPTSTTVQGLVDAAVAALVAGAPGALNTLDELAAALGDDANFAATVANSLATLNSGLANRYTKAESDARYVQGAVQTEMVFTATANQSAFTLSTPIINKPSALVTVDGVVQPTSEYTLSQDGVTLTLSEGVPGGTIVRVLALGVASAGAPADDTITTPKLRDGAVTAAKADVATQAEAEAGTSSTKLMTPQRTAQAIAALGGSTTVYYNRRPPLQRGSLFYKTAATAISIVAGAVLNGRLYSAATAVTMPGSFTNNTDYAIWQHPSTGALVADASFTTAPAGATGGSIVGGFHYIPSGRPTAVNNGSPTGSAEILEFSLWDLTYRPSCPDPRGMACINDAFWIDLFLAGATSYAGTTFSAVPSSRIGLTIADGSSAPLVPAQYGGNGSTTYGSFTWFEASEMAASFGKRLPSYGEFSAAAFGAPEASSRGSDPGTVQWERVSKFGLAQATGTLWVWGSDTATTVQPTAWTTGSETEGRGQVYGAETRAVLLGGSWADGSFSGSRCASWSLTPWNSSNAFGARFAAGHLVLG